MLVGCDTSPALLNRVPSRSSAIARGGRRGVRAAVLLTDRHSATSGSRRRRPPPIAKAGAKRARPEGSGKSPRDFRGGRSACFLDHLARCGSHEFAASDKHPTSRRRAVLAGRRRRAPLLPCSCPAARESRRCARGSRRRRRVLGGCSRSRATRCTATSATSRRSSRCSCSDSRCGRRMCSPRQLPKALPATHTPCAPALAGGPDQLGAVQHAHGLPGLARRGDG